MKKFLYSPFFGVLVAVGGLIANRMLDYFGKRKN
jgi:hypothetical protein